MRLPPRERAWVAWASVLPDLDGIGLVIDWIHKALGRPESSYYETWHHTWGHGGAFGLLLALIAFGLVRERVKTALMVLASFHLHLLCDLLGSRGSSPVDLWPIAYFAPFAAHPAFVWSGQWPLTSWQNTTLTLLLLLGSGVLAVKRGHSPLALFSRRADAALVAALRRRFGDASA